MNMIQKGNFGMHQFFHSSRIAASGLQAHRRWLDVISNNIANIQTVDTEKYDKKGNFTPYARQVPIFSRVLSEKFRGNKIRKEVANGVTIREIHAFKDDVIKVYDPHHPAARKLGSKDAGYVYYPNVDISQEMVDAKIAQSGYEANSTLISMSNKMFHAALTIGRRN